MLEKEVHGIGAAGRIDAGRFASNGGQVWLELSDGTRRSFGADSAFARECLAQVGERTVHFENGMASHAASLTNIVAPSAVILEITPFCDLGCPTCIATSVPTRRGERVASAITRDLEWLIGAHAFPSELPVFLSGGEPTEHPEFGDVIASAEFLKIAQRYVITNGLRFADPSYAARFAAASPGTRLYLQYDSDRAEDLVRIRGSDFSEVRRLAIENCERARIPYTLVCVVLRGVNDGRVRDVIEANLPREYCEGITFQPIKFVGRNEFASAEHRLTAFDMAADLQVWLRDQFQLVLAPHPANPLNWLIAYEGDRTSSHCLYKQGSSKRVAIVWHTDVENFVLESTAAFPIEFLADRALSPMEIRYNSI